MKKRNMIRSALSLLLAMAFCLSAAACSGNQTAPEQVQESPTAEPAAPEATAQEQKTAEPVVEEKTVQETAQAALPVKALRPKQVEENPYMAKSDANIHHDGYNTDSTDEILPIGIYPEINVSYETTNANA